MKKIATLYGVLFFVFVSCQNTKQQVINEAVRLNEDIFSKITIHLTQEGKLKAIVSADKAIRKKIEYNGEMESEFFGHFNADFFEIATGKKDMFIQSKYCKLNEKTNYMFMKDSVYIETTRGDKIHAKDLTWNNITERFTTQDSIDIERPNERVRGVGFSGNADLSNYQIFKSVGSTQSQTIEF